MGGLRTLGVVFVVVLLGAAAAVGPAAGQEELVTLTVTVETEGGDSVAGVELTATWDGGSETVTTRASGQALVDVPAGADVEIAVDHDEYVRNTPYLVRDATTREVAVPVRREGFAAVSVTDADGAVSGATVRFQDGGLTVANVRTGSNGVAESGPIEHGSYALIVAKPGYFEHQETVTVGNGSEFQVTLERGTAEVSFTVVDDHFEEPRPVRNATIAIEPLGTTLRTLAGGEAGTGLPVNTDYDVTVSKDGYVAATQDLSLGASDRTVSVSINREAAVHLAVANERVVVGETTTATVTNAYDEPIEGAAVTVGGASVGQTDADGEVSVPIESAGAATVRATYEGRDAEVTVEGVEPGGDETPTPTATTSTPGGLGPGPGIAGALLAIAVTLAFLARRR